MSSKFHTDVLYEKIEENDIPQVREIVDMFIKNFPENKELVFGTALIKAVENNNQYIAELLIDRGGADVNYIGNLLYEKIEENNIPQVREIVDMFIKLNKLYSSPENKELVFGAALTIAEQSGFRTLADMLRKVKRGGGNLIYKHKISKSKKSRNTNRKVRRNTKRKVRK